MHLEIVKKCGLNQDIYEQFEGSETLLFLLKSGLSEAVQNDSLPVVKKIFSWTRGPGKMERLMLPILKIMRLI
jgi:hypothetical protein